MNTEQQISKAASILGSIGGKAGTGNAKVRRSESCRLGAFKRMEKIHGPMPGRFWNRVKKGAKDECWPWTGGCNGAGYGSFWLDGRCHTASKYAWVLTHGDPGEFFVCHTCDNPPCCNPCHLFLGTHDDNIKDAVKKKRFPSKPGEKSHRAKITNKQASQIRKDYIPWRVTRKELGDKYGLSVAAIKDIVSGRHYPT